MVGLRASERRRALDRVEPVHVLRVVGHPAPVGEIPGVADRRGSAGEEVSVQREDDVRFVEVVDGVGLRRRRRGPPVVRDRIPVMPFRLRIRLLIRATCSADRRRRDRSR